MRTEITPHCKKKRKEKSDYKERVVDMENKIIQIAYHKRPNVNRPIIFKENRQEWIDLLRCAILQKGREEKEMEEFFKKWSKD